LRQDAIHRHFTWLQIKLVVSSPSTLSRTPRVFVFGEHAPRVWRHTDETLTRVRVLFINSLPKTIANGFGKGRTIFKKTLRRTKPELARIGGGPTPPITKHLDY